MSNQPSPWVPTQDISELKILGKALEEAGEYTTVLARVLIQGINENEPRTGKPNREWIEDEIADVLATVGHVAGYFRLDTIRIDQRAKAKAEYLQRWFEMEVE